MATTPESQEIYSESDCTVRTQDRYKEQCILCGPLKDHFSTSRMTLCMTSTRESFCMSLSFWSTIVSTQATLLSLSLMTAFHTSILSPIHPHPLTLHYSEVVSTSYANLLQMIALATEFPVLLGDKIPTTDEKWESFLLLLKICAIPMSPECSHNTIAYLGVLVEEKLSTFRRLYPSTRIIPKLHFMVHYPGQIEMYDHLSIPGQCNMKLN